MKHDKMALLGGALRGLRLPANVSEPKIGALSVIDRKLVVGDGDSWSIVEDFSPSLYAFTEYTFTSAGRTGRTGPTLAHCQTAYEGQAFLTANAGQYFNCITGKQFWTAPADATYRFVITGPTTASTSRNGSTGVMTFDIALTMGEVVELLVGQRGTVVLQGMGGSGACMVRTDKQGLIAILGGAGANPSGNSTTTVIGNSSPAGPNGQTSASAPNGGIGYTNRGTMAACGGGGYTGDGGSINLTGIFNNTTFTAAVNLSNANPTGGTASGTSASNCALGGFGGGASVIGSGQSAAGGGGGYAGGNGGFNYANSGSSYWNASLVHNNTLVPKSVSAADRADGSIKITRL